MEKENQITATIIHNHEFPVPDLETNQESRKNNNFEQSKTADSIARTGNIEVCSSKIGDGSSKMGDGTVRESTMLLYNQLNESDLI